MADAPALALLVETSRAVTETPSRNAKIARLAELLRTLGPRHAPTGVAWLSGELRQGRIGVGHASLSDALESSTADRATLNIAQVDAVFDRIAKVSGRGSTAAKADALGNLFSRATSEERHFLAALLGGGLRQGALDGVMQDALARATEVSLASVRRAAMLAGDLPTIAAAAFEDGEAGLARFGLRLFRPILPMLADSAEDVAAATLALGEGAFDFKMDGARIQVHRQNDDVRVYTRKLNDVTASVPEVVEAALALPVREAVLDGETLAFRDDGTPHPFQLTMRRFGRRLDVASLRRELPLTPFFFDVLYVDGETLIDRPARNRFDALDAAAPGRVVPRLITDNATRAEAFLAEARAAGHEGIMAKRLDSTYEAGRRGGAWLKIKPIHTLDLVILAAEWGHGRRKGWLSNLHLGARDAQSGGFVMLGKTFKGLTDDMLTWQTRALLEREVSRDDWTVYVRPEIVAEIAFNEIQTSPRYPGGLALRFARVKAYRPDKNPAEADTIETVRALHASMVGVD